MNNNIKTHLGNEQLKFEIKNTVSFTIAPKMNLCINLTKNTQDVYAENDKFLGIKIKIMIGKLNIVKKSVLLNLIKDSMKFQ